MPVYTAQVVDNGRGGVIATLDLEGDSTATAKLVIEDKSDAFGAMCVMLKTLRNLGARGSVEGIYHGETVLNPFQGHGLPIAGR